MNEFIQQNENLSNTIRNFFTIKYNYTNDCNFNWIA